MCNGAIYAENDQHFLRIFQNKDPSLQKSLFFTNFFLRILVQNLYSLLLFRFVKKTFQYFWHLKTPFRAIMDRLETFRKNQKFTIFGGPSPQPARGVPGRFVRVFTSSGAPPEGPG